MESNITPDIEESQSYVDLRDEESPSSSFEANSDTGAAALDLSKEKEQVKDRSGLLKKILIIASGIALVLVAIYFGGVYYFQNHFLPNTYISGFNSSFQTLEKVNEKLDAVSHARKVSLVGKDSVVSDVRAEDIGLNLVKPEESQQIMDNQNEYLWPLYLVNIYQQRSANDQAYNEEALNTKIQELPIVTGEQVVKTENARAAYNGTSYVVKDEVYGTEVNTEALKEKIAEALENGESEIDLEETGCYVMPTLLKDNANLNQNINALNTALNSVITYDFKSSQEVLDKNTFAGWLSTDDQGNVTVNDQEVANYIQGLKDKYDTLGKEFTFHSSGGQDMTFTSWYSGFEIDADAEKAALKDNLLAGQPVTKEPIYSSTGKNRAQGRTISGTYLEISIDDQRMWFYKDGQLLVETPVVTGDVSAGHGTTTGLYEIQGKETDVVLTDNATYESPVTYWMPFNGGIGVHDATWRGAFGGSIYLGNGSHGCVNTPYGAAGTIYENIEVGDTVVVY